MLKRIAITLGIVLGVVLLGFGYLWLRDLQAHRQMRKEAETLVGGLTAQADELRALGDVNIEPTNLSYAQLKRQLGEPSLKKNGRLNTTLIGWGCAEEHCAIFAAFQVPFGQEIPESTRPISITMLAPFSSTQSHLGIDNVYLGEKMDEIAARFQGKNIDRTHGRNRVALAKDWNLTWSGDAKASLLLLSRNVTEP